MNIKQQSEVAMRDKRKAYEEKLDAQLDEWKEQIDLHEAKLEYYKTIDALQHKQDDVRTKLHELKTAGDEAWEDLKIGAGKAWAEVEATSKFKEARLLNYQPGKTFLWVTKRCRHDGAGFNSS